MRVERILEITPDLAEQMKQMAETINDPDLNFEAFTDYFVSSLDRIGVFGAFDGNDLKAFVYFEPPTPVYPKRGYAYLTCSDKTTPHAMSRAVFDMACQWVIEQGATYLWGWTSRDVKVIHRIYGFEPVKERQIILPLIGNDHLRIERDTQCMNAWK